MVKLTVGWNRSILGKVGPTSPPLSKPPGLARPLNTRTYIVVLAVDRPTLGCRQA